MVVSTNLTTTGRLVEKSGQWNVVALERCMNVGNPLDASSGRTWYSFSLLAGDFEVLSIMAMDDTVIVANIKPFISLPLCSGGCHDGTYNMPPCDSLHVVAYIK